MFTLFAQLPLYVMAPSQFQAQQAQIVIIIIEIWTVVLTTVMVLNVGAFFLATQLQRNRKALSQSGSSNDHIEKLISRVKKSAAWIVFILMLVIINLNYMLPAFARTVVSDPRCDITFELSAVRTGIITWLAAFGVPLWFVSTILHERHSSRAVSNKVSTVVRPSSS
jgi:hypothetical protein